MATWRAISALGRTLLGLIEDHYPSAELDGATVEYLALLSDTIDRYLAALKDLSPPGEVAAAHEEYVAAIQASRNALPATRRAVEEAEDLAGVQLALTASGFADSQLRWTAACTSLEQSVRDAGRGIDLRCTRSVESTP